MPEDRYLQGRDTQPVAAEEAGGIGNCRVIGSGGGQELHEDQAHGEGEEGGRMHIGDAQCHDRMLR